MNVTEAWKFTTILSSYLENGFEIWHIPNIETMEKDQEKNQTNKK